MAFAVSNVNLTHEYVSENSNVSVTDSNEEGLKVYYYNECDESSDENIKNTRGVVFDKDGKIVMKTFGFTPEYSVKDYNLINNVVLNGIDNSMFTYNSDTNMFELSDKGVIIFESEEGSLIRVFNYNEKWYISTHRKLDAYHSKWSSKVSFGAVFESAITHLYNTSEGFKDWVGELGENKLIDQFLTKLNPEHQYTFLLRNTKENRIVCKEPDHPTVYYVGSFWNEGNSFGFDAIPISTPRRPLLNSTDEIVKFVESCDPNSIQGVIIVTKDNKIYKIMNDSYNELYSVRDNCPSVKFRYLQVRTNPVLKQQLIKLYPNFVSEFNKYESVILEIAKEIHNAYISRFVNKQYRKVSPDLYVIIKICHGMHIADRNVKITFPKVLETLNKQSGVYLNRIIKTHLHVKRD